MGTFKFSMHMLVKEYKKNMFYGLTLVFAVAVCFVFFNIIYNPELVDQRIMVSGGTWDQVWIPFSTILSFIIICFCCFMVFFANNFFLKRKTTELAIMAMSGSGYIASTMYVLYQTFVMLFIATPLGMLIGRLCVPISNRWMYSLLDVTKDISIIPIESYKYSALLIGIVLSMICIITAGFLHRNDIQVLLSEEKEMYSAGGKNRFSLIFVVLYFGGIYMMFMNPHSGIAYIAPTLVGVAGATGIIRYVLPNVFRRLKKNQLLKKRYALIATSNLGYSIQRSLLLFTLMIVSVTSMMAALALYKDQPREFVTTVMGYIVIIVLLVISIIYKLIMEASSRKILFFNLWKIGYTRQELKKIVMEEIIMYFAILILLPLVYIIVIAGRFAYYGDMTLGFAMLFSLAYIIPMIISGIITYYQYTHIVVTPIKGGK